MPKWFNLLKPGTFETAGKDGAKKVVEITTADLDNIVRTYNPANFAAAFTIGHPASQKEPAFGFVASLKKVGDMVLFTPGKVVAEFAKAVNDGLFPRISAGLEKTDKGWGLNHIAFLGAWKPAVPGLGMIEFAAAGPVFDEIELADWNKDKAEFAQGSDIVNWIESRLNTIGRMLSSVREFMIEKYDVDTADKFINSYDLEYIGSPAPDYVENPAAGSTLFAQPEPDSTALLAAATAENAQLVTALQEANARLAAIEVEKKKDFVNTARADFAAYVDTQIAARRVLPAEKDFLINTLLSLSKAEAAQGNDVALLATPDLVAYKAHIERRPQHSLTKEVATNGAGETPEMSVAELAGYAEQYVQEQTKAGKKTSYADAVGFVRANPKKFIKG